ncbi:MAG: hypothetical protein QXK00_01285 [archaeon]
MNWILNRVVLCLFVVFLVGWSVRLDIGNEDFVNKQIKSSIGVGKINIPETQPKDIIEERKNVWREWGRMEWIGPEPKLSMGPVTTEVKFLKGWNFRGIPGFGPTSTIPLEKPCGPYTEVEGIYISDFIKTDQITPPEYRANITRIWGYVRDPDTHTMKWALWDKRKEELGIPNSLRYLVPGQGYFMYNDVEDDSHAYYVNDLRVEDCVDGCNTTQYLIDMARYTNMYVVPDYMRCLPVWSLPNEWNMNAFATALKWEYRSFWANMSEIVQAFDAWLDEVSTMYGLPKYHVIRIESPLHPFSSNRVFFAPAIWDRNQDPQYNNFTKIMTEGEGFWLYISENENTTVTSSPPSVEGISPPHKKNINIDNETGEIRIGKYKAE